jgi:hypothetical protein
VLAYKPSMGEAEAEGLRVWSQPVLHNKTLSQKKKKKNKLYTIDHWFESNTLAQVTSQLKCSQLVYLLLSLFWFLLIPSIWLDCSPWVLSDVCLSSVLCFFVYLKNSIKLHLRNPFLSFGFLNVFTTIFI